MKKSILQFLFLALFLCVISCTPEPSCESCSFTCISDFDNDVFTNECKNKYDCSKELLIDSELNIDENNPIVSSTSNFVIKFHSFFRGSDNISDDEYSYDILMQIDNSVESFAYDNEDLQNLNLMSKTVCFCPDREFMYITEGCIQAEKIGNTWYVQGSIEVLHYGGLFEFDISIQ